MQFLRKIRAMIIYFKVGNYKSIKDPVILNFQAASLSEHEENVLDTGNSKLVKSLLVYGHNASGKSSLIEAFVIFRQLLTGSTTFVVDQEIPAEPFALSEATEHAPSFFECMFLSDGVKYRYGFEADRKRIHKEWLLESKVTKENPLFLRSEDEYQVDKKRLPNAEGLQVRTRKNVLFLSVAGQWAVTKAEHIISYFNSAILLHGMMDENYKQMTVSMLSNKDYSDILKEFITKADLGIVDMDLFDISSDTEKEKDAKPQQEVFTLHTKYDRNNLPLEDLVPLTLMYHESEGTRKYFNMIGPIIFALYNNRFMVIDEFDAKLHSLLSKAILKLFNSGRIKSTAQLLIASHDTALLDKALLRRDQIAFVEKDSYGATNLTMLSTYKPRKEAPYDKNYLEGKYGGIPVIEELGKIFEPGEN